MKENTEEKPASYGLDTAGAAFDQRLNGYLNKPVLTAKEQQLQGVMRLVEQLRAGKAETDQADATPGSFLKNDARAAHTAPTTSQQKISSNPPHILFQALKHAREQST